LDGQQWIELAALYVYANDDAGYRNVCSEMSKQAERQLVGGNDLAMAYALGDWSKEECAQAIRLAEADLAPARTIAWSPIERAALLMLKRDLDQAATLLEVALKQQATPARRTLAWLMLSKVKHLGDQDEEAKKRLLAATQ
jgi:hypothetical protein